MRTHQLNGRAEIEACLEHPDLSPPPPGPSLGNGATLRLRERMARFSGDGDHTLRRAAVVVVLESMNLTEVDPLARHLTRSHIIDGQTELEGIASRVPVDVVAGLLGIRYDGQGVDRFRLLNDDIALVAGAIGAGAPVDIAVDAATSRVLEACGGWVDGGVAKASLLYQTYDATRSLVMTIAACPPGSRRDPAVLATKRVAIDHLSLCDRDIDLGDLVTVDIGAVGLEFGHGPHQCPGRELAELIATAIAQEFADAKYGSTHD